MKPAQAKIIWGIDPFEDNLKFKNQFIAALRHMARKYNAVVEPVHILEVSIHGSSSTRISASQEGHFKDAAEKAVQAILKELDGLNFLPPRILVVEDGTLVDAVQALSKHAIAVGASLIAVGTHARHGLSRLLLGSFAEALLQQAELPVVTVNPECSESIDYEKILFATDFDEGATHAFRKALLFAKTLGAEITLLHVESHPLQSGISPDAGSVSGQEKHARDLAAPWLADAKKAGVPAALHQVPPLATIADPILQHAKTANVGWIAMAAKSGPLKAALLGSVTRDVVRAAPCPVWVLGPKF